MSETVWLLSPELVLLLIGAALLGLDALRPRQEERRWLPVTALAGLAGALVATISLWGCSTPVLSVLSCDKFALAFKAITLVVTAIVVLISSDTILPRRNRRHGAFYALLLLSAVAICLVSAATDLVMIVAALELFHVTSGILVGALRGDPRSGEAAAKTFLYHAAFSAMMLYGLSWIYGVTGATDLRAIADGLQGSEPALRSNLLLPLILITVGLTAKAAVIPFHQWMPDVFEGTGTPAAVFFAAGPLLAGFAALMRLLTMWPAAPAPISGDWRTLLMALAAITMIMGPLLALWQQDARRLLAYLGIAQVGTILVGIAAASPQGTAGALFTLAAHVLSSLGALAAISALSKATGSTAIQSYAGVHRQAPELAWPLLACLLSLAGFPPLAGFVGRLYLLWSAVAEGLRWLAIVGAVGNLISLACLWKIMRVMFISPAQAEERLAIPPLLAVALGAATIGLIAATLLAYPLLRLLEEAAQVLFG